MKNLLSIIGLIVITFSDAHTMQPKNHPQFDNTDRPWLKNWKIVPVTRYELKNPTFNVLLIPEWQQIVLQNRFFWKRVDLPKPKYKNIPVYAPLHIRYDTPSNQIMDSLHASFRPQELTHRKGTITVLDDE